MCSQEGLTLKDELYKMIKENVACFEWFSKEEAKRESHKPIELDNTGKQVHKLFGDAAA
jgi:hypothetical protein